MDINITISEDMYRRFTAACILSGQDQQKIICKKIEEFVAATFANEMYGLSVLSQPPIKTTGTQSKVLTRIPLWAKRPDQHNHKILKSFFVVERDGMTTRERMKDFFLANCYGNAWQFDNNFNSMRTNDGNSHGLVFTCVNDLVTLSEEASSIAHKYREYFLADVDSSILVEHQERNASSVQQSLFVAWFKEQLYRGRPYNPVTISGYASRIASACNDPSFKSIEPKNLFEIENYDDYMKIRNQIMACPGFEAFDAKSHRGFTAALNKYADFLLRDRP